jgi:excisionase family DNA binding protein
MSRGVAVGPLGRSDVQKTNTRTDAGDRLLSIREIQERPDFSRTLVYSLQDSGELPFHKIRKLRKFNVRDVDAYVQRLRVGLGLEPAEKSG